VAPGRSPFWRCDCAWLTNARLAGLSVAGGVRGRSFGS